jgi:hypothetical protein
MAQREDMRCQAVEVEPVEKTGGGGRGRPAIAEANGCSPIKSLSILTF